MGMLEAMNVIAAGDLSAEIDVSSTDEVGQLAVAIGQTGAGIRTALQCDHVNWEQVGKQQAEATRLGAMVRQCHDQHDLLQYRNDGNRVCEPDRNRDPRDASGTISPSPSRASSADRSTSFMRIHRFSGRFSRTRIIFRTRRSSTSVPRSSTSVSRRCMTRMENTWAPC